MHIIVIFFLFSLQNVQILENHLSQCYTRLPQLIFIFIIKPPKTMFLLSILCRLFLVHFQSKHRQIHLLKRSPTISNNPLPFILTPAICISSPLFRNHIFYSHQFLLLYIIWNKKVKAMSTSKGKKVKRMSTSKGEKKKE